MSRLYFPFGMVGVEMGIGWREVLELLVDGGDEDLVVDDFGSGLGIDHGNKKYYADKRMLLYF